MSKIITIAHQKGGVGKSTLALNLAYSFAKNVNIILTDIDLQGSTIQLQGLISDVTIIPFSNNIYNQKYISEEPVEYYGLKPLLMLC